MKKLSVLILVILAMLFTIKPSMAEGSLVKICINGIFLYLDTDPIMNRGSVFVPIRTISEGLGFDVEYIEETKTINIIKDDKDITVTIGSNKAAVNDNEVLLDVKPFIIDGRTFVPLRFISEGLGEEVSWDSKNRIVLIGEYKGETTITDSFLYTNEEHGYTLNFPNTWKKEAIIETKDGVLYVYDKKSVEKFIENGVANFGPVFEVRYSNSPVIATVPYDTNYILHYDGKGYIESIFDLDFQYYPETKDSYVKIWNEGQEVMASFKDLGDTKLIDKEMYKSETKIVNDILDNYAPKNIFKRHEIYTLRKPSPDFTLLNLRNLIRGNEVQIKIEALFNNNEKLIRYHLKNYGYDLQENKLTQDEALKKANSFIQKYVDKNIELIRTPDLYPSLYEDDKHEAYGDRDWKYVVIIDLEHGFVELFSEMNN